jgi:hypothetical protein
MTAGPPQTVGGFLIVNGVRDVTEQPPPSQPSQPPQQYRPMPVSTFQLAGQTTADVVSGLGKSPLMLSVVVLNVIGILAAVYFLNLLIHGQQQHLEKLLSVQQAHLKEVLDGQAAQYKEILRVHDREFDALVEMAGRAPMTPVPTTSPPRGGR